MAEYIGRFGAPDFTRFDRYVMLMLETLAMALRDPPGFAVYAAVALAVKLRPQAAEWSRGR